VHRISRRRFLIGSFWMALHRLWRWTLWQSVTRIAMTFYSAVFAGVCRLHPPGVMCTCLSCSTALRASGIGWRAPSAIGSAFSTFLLRYRGEHGIHAALAACVAVLAAEL